MKETIQLQVIFNAKSSQVYEAWLSSAHHTKMTGGEAVCTQNIGDTFSAWDGYITGKNIALVPNQKIVQSWRTTEFDEKDEDSELTILLKEIPNGTQMTLRHINIPEGQTQYRQGWEDHYFEPMRNYFNALP